jgi:FlaA1/EpsC-like NDP-sugar epimerase
MDIVKALQNNKNVKIVGIRPGEKLHEELISKAEGYNTFDLGNFFIIAGNQKLINIYKKKKYKKFKIGENYNSLNNSFLTVAQIKKLIKNYQNRKTS